MPELLSLDDPHTVRTNWWHATDDGRVQCDICPRACKLREGQRGVCFVRGRIDDQIVLTTYGRSSGFCVDPIEKKPLNHFLPGSSVLSFGTAGCNLACRYCQNWDISKSKEIDTLADAASPEGLAQAALDLGCPSIAFTYNDPTVFMEYAIDTAIACREVGVRSVAVTAAYIEPGPRRELFAHLDAANVDLKAFTDEFYRHVAMADLKTVLDSLVHMRTETDMWIELTTLLIPGHNDTTEELTAMCKWILAELGADTPVHFTRFHPDYRMLDVPATPPETLTRARSIALDVGLRYAYTGNVHDTTGGSTHCPGCGEAVVVRDWYDIESWKLDGSGHCRACGTEVAGVFDGPPGEWGRRRQAVQLKTGTPIRRCTASSPRRPATTPWPT